MKNLWILLVTIIFLAGCQKEHHLVNSSQEQSPRLSSGISLGHRPQEKPASLGYEQGHVDPLDQGSPGPLIQKETVALKSVRPHVQRSLVRKTEISSVRIRPNQLSRSEFGWHDVQKTTFTAGIIAINALLLSGMLGLFLGARTSQNKRKLMIAGGTLALIALAEFGGLLYMGLT